MSDLCCGINYVMRNTPPTLPVPCTLWKKYTPHTLPLKLNYNPHNSPILLIAPCRTSSCCWWQPVDSTFAPISICLYISSFWYVTTKWRSICHIRFSRSYNPIRIISFRAILYHQKDHVLDVQKCRKHINFMNAENGFSDSSQRILSTSPWRC